MGDFIRVTIVAIMFHDDLVLFLFFGRRRDETSAISSVLLFDVDITLFSLCDLNTIHLRQCGVAASIASSMCQDSTTKSTTDARLLFPSLPLITKLTMKERLGFFFFKQNSSLTKRRIRALVLVVMVMQVSWTSSMLLDFWDAFASWATVSSMRERCGPGAWFW